LEIAALQVFVEALEGAERDGGRRGDWIGLHF
jgi:hypothetical protein